MMTARLSVADLPVATGRRPPVARRCDLTAEEILAWLDWRRRVDPPECRPLTWKETRTWRVSDGAIRHDSGRFFTVRGLRVRTAEGALVEQPLIDQSDIGILGWLVRRRGNRTQILVQAKAEPGNIGGVQLAPTVQATTSNYTRVHGGAPTPYLDRFLERLGNASLGDSLQSEHGSRFFGKYNRNTVQRVDGDEPAPHGENWRWCDLGAILRLLAKDFCLNTDARSALVCADWRRLAPSGRPFDRKRGGDFASKLEDSFLANDGDAESNFSEILDLLGSLRRRFAASRSFIPIEQVPGWRLDAACLADERRRHFSVKPYRVRAPSREVSDWDQPLLQNRFRGASLLLCQRRAGILHFLLKARFEPGFRNGVQLGPTALMDGRRRKSERWGRESLVDFLLNEPRHRVRIASRQSEEGGRFYRNIVDYRVVEAPAGVDVPAGAGAIWVTLAQIQRLTRIEGAVTNEGRSAISLLLSYL